MAPTSSKLNAFPSSSKILSRFFVFEFPYIISLYYIKNQQDATLAVLFISHCKITAVATDVGRPYWIYIIPTYDVNQWLLLQF